MVLDWESTFMCSGNTIQIYPKLIQGVLARTQCKMFGESYPDKRFKLFASQISILNNIMSNFTKFKKIK